MLVRPASGSSLGVYAYPHLHWTALYLMACTLDFLIPPFVISLTVFDISFDSLAHFINRNIPIEFYKHFVNTLKHDIFDPV